MRNIVILTIVSFSLMADSYAFWIWSPHKSKWLSSAAEYTDPSSQLKAAMRYFNSRRYKQALGEFSKLIKHYPDSKESADAQYYLGRSFEKIGKPYQAFLAFDKLVTTYPNSNHIQDAAAAEFRIGVNFLSWKEKRLLGVPLSLMEDHPSVIIFNKIVETLPYSKYAPKALYELGVFFLKHLRNEEAEETFKRLIDNYSDSALVGKAQHKLAVAILRSSSGTDYDQGGISEAYSRLKEISQSSRDDIKTNKVSKEMEEIKERKAKKVFDIASFYEKQNKFKSALIYYRIVANEYPDTSFTKVARERIKALKEIAE